MSRISRNKERRTSGRTDGILRRAFDAESDGNIEAAIRLFKQASRLGSNDARSKLGTIYDDVLSRPDPIKAVYWYRRGVAGGDASCAWNLAMHYAGTGRRSSYLYWLRVAAKMGDADAPKEIACGRWWVKRNPG